MSPLITDVTKGASQAGKAAKGAAGAVGAAEQAGSAAAQAAKAAGATEKEAAAALKKDLLQKGVAEVTKKDEHGVIRRGAKSVVRLGAASATFGLAVPALVAKDIAGVLRYRKFLRPSFTAGLLLFIIVVLLDLFCIILYLAGGAGAVLDTFVDIVEGVGLGMLYSILGFQPSPLTFFITFICEFIPVVNILPIWSYQCYGALMKTWQPQARAAARAEKEAAASQFSDAASDKQQKMDGARERLGLNGEGTENGPGGQPGQNGENPRQRPQYGSYATAAPGAPNSALPVVDLRSQGPLAATAGSAAPKPAVANS